MILLQIVTAISLFYMIAASVAAISYFRKAGSSPEPVDFPLSVLKPTHVYREDLHEAIQSVCAQNYTKYQIILGTESKDPVLQNFLQKIREKNRDCDMTLVFADRKEGRGNNGKIRILTQMCRSAAYAVLVISDSDMVFTDRYLQSVAAPFCDPKVGMVTCLYRSVAGKGLAGALEAFAINLNFLPSVMIARMLGDIDFAFGATMAVRKEALEKIGGLDSLKNYLADDYMLGNRVYNAGYQVCLSDYLVDSINHIRSFPEFFLHQLRWAKTYRICRPWGYFFSIITHTFTLSLLVFCVHPDIAVGSFWVASVLLARFLSSAGLAFSGIHKGYWRYFWALPLFDVIQSVIWALAFAGGKVVWAGTFFQVGKDGIMVPAKEK